MPAAAEELRARLAAAQGAGAPDAPGGAGWAVHRLLPVPAPLDTLFPGGGLARGTVVAVEGSLWLALGLVAAASQAGSWCAVVGMRHLSAAAAAEAGVDLTRLVLVPSPGQQWATAVGALLDGLDVVMVCPPRDVRAGEARRLAARARERRSTLVPLGPWPDTVDQRVRVTESEWVGLHRGYGRITGRRCRVAACGRGAAARERRVVATLPVTAATSAGSATPRPGAPSAAAAAGPLPAGGAPFSEPPPFDVLAGTTAGSA
jgi:hypothetical protein